MDHAIAELKACLNLLNEQRNIVAANPDPSKRKEYLTKLNGWIDTVEAELNELQGLISQAV